MKGHPEQALIHEMSFDIEGLHMCITEHYLLQAKMLKVFKNFNLFEGKNKNKNMT